MMKRTFETWLIRMQEHCAQGDMQDALSSFSEKQFSSEKWTKSVFHDYGIVRLLSDKVSSTIVKFITMHLLSSLVLQYYKRINLLLMQSHNTRGLTQNDIKIILEKKEQKLSQWVESDLINIFDPLIQMSFTKDEAELEEFADICYSSFYMLDKIDNKKLAEQQLLLFDMPYQFQSNLKMSPILPKVVHAVRIEVDKNEFFYSLRMQRRDEPLQIEAKVEWTTS